MHQDIVVHEIAVQDVLHDHMPVAARIAGQSALTGHFVLSSLHATDAVAALHRFLDMGIESFLIASSVIAVPRAPAASQAHDLRTSAAAVSL